jgi:hypothetical protein
MVKGLFFPRDGQDREPAHSPSGTVTATLLIYGSTVLFSLFFSLFLSSVGFALGIPLTSGHFFFILPSTLAFALISSLIFPYRGRLSGTLIVLGLLVFTFYLSLYISRNFFDISYDGQGYHQEALMQLSSGWNPFYEQLNSLESNNMDRWLNHYSKGVWIYESILFKVTRDIESAKLFHLWLMSAAFIFALSFLLRFKKIPTTFIFLVSLLAAFNPVSIYQSLSFYLDGQLMSLMVILLAIMGLIYTESNGYYYFLLLMVISVLVNVKLTAGIYAFIFVAAYMAILWMKKRHGRLRKVFLSAGGAFILGFLLFGWSPYVTNLVYQGNPLYPALGTDRSDYTLPQFPANFNGKNSGYLLFYSIFAKSDNVRGTDRLAHLKVPFTFSGDELKAFTDTNAKQGGFGPIFGGAILLSFLVAIWGLVTLWREKRRLGNHKGNSRGVHREGAKEAPLATIGLLLFCMGVILVSCLINPASSLARFIPQMWLFPIFAFFLAYHSNKRPVRMIGGLIIWILLLNNILIAYTYYGYNSNITGLYKDRLGRFAATGEQNPHKFYFGHFRTSNTSRFNKLGIHYEIVENKEDCGNGKRILPNSIILKCN